MKFGERKTTLLQEMFLILKEQNKKLKIIICVLSILLIFALTMIAYLGHKLYVNNNPDARIDAVHKTVIPSYYMSYNIKQNTIKKDGRKKPNNEEQL